MKSEKYKVLSVFNQKSKVQIWDGTHPLPLDSEMQFVLEAGPDSPQIRPLTRAASASLKKDVLTITPAAGSHGIDLGPDHRVHLRKLKPIPPAYLTSSEDAWKEGGVLQLTAYSGAGRALLDSNSIGSAYIGYSRNKPVFTLRASAEGYQIRGLIPGLKLKLKGKPPSAAEPGEILKLSADDLVHCTLIRGSRWWRFSLAHVRELTTSSRGKIVEAAESKYFKKLLAGFAAIFALFTVAVFVLPKVEKHEPQEEKEAPIVKFKEANAKPKPKVAAAAAPAAAAPPAPPAPPPRVAPPPAPVKQAVQKSAPQKQVATKAPLTAPPKISKNSKGRPAVSAATEVTALKSALGAAFSLAQKEVPRSNRAPSQNQNSKDLFKASNTSNFQSTQVASGYSSSSSVQVQGTGAGYTHGTASAISDRVGSAGASFTSVDEKEIVVETGLTMDEVGAVINSHKQEVRYCHETAMIENPKLNGKVTIQFSIHPSGRVESASLQTSTVGSSQLENCILRKLKLWKFPKPKGGVHVAVAYPFIFKVLDRE